MGALARSGLWDAERRCTEAPSRVQVIRSGRAGSVLARRGTYPAILNHALPNRPPVPRRGQATPASSGRWGVSGGNLEIDTLEHPLARSMAERQCQAGVRRLDLEQGARPGD